MDSILNLCHKFLFNVCYQVDTEYHADFGIFQGYEDYLNSNYNNTCTRLNEFALEAGVDPYNRKANCEPILYFTLMNNLDELPVDTIYKFFVQEKLNHSSKSDMNYIEDDFIIVNKQQESNE